MPSDFITIKALSEELNNMLFERRIEKISMPEKDEICFNLSMNGNKKYSLLYISANASNPRIHLSNVKKENPEQAPMFCMRLRKNIIGGVIKKVSIINEDRIISISILSRNELHDLINYNLIFEIMGRYSNIILTNSSNKILDVLKQVPYDTMTKRTLLPNAIYTFPEQNKITAGEKDKIINYLSCFSGGDLSKYLFNGISGFSKETINELITKSQLSNEIDSLNEEEIEKLSNTIDMLYNIYSSNNYSPCVSYVDGNPKDFYVYPYYSVTSPVLVEDLNYAISSCLALKDSTQRQLEKTKFLQKAYNSYLNKLNNRLKKSQQKYAETSIKDDCKLFGDLILSNIYKISKGDKTLSCVNYFLEDQPNITIKLDENLSPQQNAQAYYKKYAKLKRTEDISLKQIIELEEEIKYVNSIQPFILRANTKQEIAEINEELIAIGALKAPQATKNKYGKVKNVKKEKPSDPITYLVNDFIVMVGKNNIQNDKLTFKIANGNDIWMHSKNFHGSHTIIFAEGREIPNNIVLIAAEICAYYSQGEQNTKIECDYTPRKNVKRHPNKKPGMVIYNVYNTICVTPNAHLEYLKNR